MKSDTRVQILDVAFYVPLFADTFGKPCIHLGGAVF